MPAMTLDDWECVVRKALHRGVAPLLCRGLLRAPAEIPDEIRGAAAIYLEHAVAEGDARRKQTIDVLDTLNADGIPTLALKGIALSVFAHGAPGLRPGKDIDVLVHREHMGSAVRSLAKLGYRLGESLGSRIHERCFDTYGQDILFCATRLPVEPHWTFAPRTLCVDLDLPAMWASAIEIDVAGRAVRTLSVENTLLIACLHGAKEKWWRLLWVADIAGLLQRHPAFEWRLVVERASRAGILRILHLGLGLSHVLFSSPLPEEIAEAIARDAACRRLIDESRQRVLADAQGPERLLCVSGFHLRARERYRDRLGYVFRTLITPQSVHYRMVALPSPLHFGYVPIKVVHDYALLPLWRAGKGRLWGRTRG
jgi:hypothetical protein